MKDPLLTLIQEHKQGNPIGLYSVCSSNKFVLEAAIQQAKTDRSPLLVESTSNQVDQFGGYTGMTPVDFIWLVRDLVRQQGFPEDLLIIGGDHLGPNTWQHEKSEMAMSNAHELIRCSVKAGYGKIHLDTSMRLGDDSGDKKSPLDVTVIAGRAADLCQTAEKTAAEFAGSRLPLYVIGTDVPKPGGAQESMAGVHATPVAEVEQTIEITRDAFRQRGLQDAWERVIGVVVQPGVEFGDSEIFDYKRSQAQALSQYIENQPRLIYEAHSTDYQKPRSLNQMVSDHFAILKVGPWLTYAFREAVFALALVENEWLAGKSDRPRSQLIAVVDQIMIDKPKYWRNHYQGSETELKMARKYSLSDRVRYYWPHPDIQKALHILLENLSRQPIPLSLLSQFLPVQYRAVREKEIPNHPLAIIRHKIMEITQIYASACSLGTGRFTATVPQPVADRRKEKVLER